jgi:hypothetical protein
MLFASTRLTLVRELGSEHFRESIFVTTTEELTARGFEKHDAHGALDAPLTEEERSLGEVKRAEQEAGGGTGVREIHLSKTLAMPVTEDALAALRQLNEGGEKTLVMLVSQILQPMFVPGKLIGGGVRCRKSTLRLRSSSWSRTIRVLHPSQNLPRRSRRPIHASHSTDSHTRMGDRPAALCCSSIRVRRALVPRPSKPGCCIH